MRSGTSVCWGEVLCVREKCTLVKSVLRDMGVGDMWVLVTSGCWGQVSVHCEKNFTKTFEYPKIY